MVKRFKQKIKNVMSDDYESRLEFICDDPYAHDYFERMLKTSLHKNRYLMNIINKNRTIYMIIDFKYEYDAVEFKIKHL